MKRNLWTTRKTAMAATCLTVGCAVSELHAAPPVTLVENGTPRATIVLPAETLWDHYRNASPEEIEAFTRARFPNASEERMADLLERVPAAREREARRAGDDEVLAADELVEFVEKMSGAGLPVVRPGAGETHPDGIRILLGTELARAAGLDAEIDALDPHGFLIRTGPGQVIVAGKTARGTLYGVYELLEQLGCRWIMPGPFGEIIPERETLTVAVDLTQNPSHPIHRYWWCTFGQGEHYARWTLRNKGSFVRALGDSGVSQGHYGRVPMQWEARRRGVERLPDEYYAMIRGQANTHFPNKSNPAVWDLHAEHYIDVFYRNLLSDTASISAEDGIVDDDRPETRALDSNEFDWTLGAYSATDRMWFFHRRYLDQVIAELPGRRFGVLVYANNMMPPRIETVHPAMSLVIAPLGISPLHHVRDPKSKTNRAYREWLEAWMGQARAAGAESYYYDYLPIGFQWSNFILSPQWHLIGENYPWFHELGLDGHTTQGFDDWGAMGLTAWVAIRLYWDVEQDYRDLVAEYCRFRFGENAAAAMVAYYQVFEDRMREIPDMLSNESWDNHLIIDAATRARARVALATARPLVQGDREQAHFETVALFQEAMDVWCDAIDHARETGDFAAAQTMMNRSYEIRDQLNEHYSHFINPGFTDFEQRFAPGGWRKKFGDWAEILEQSAASVVLPREMALALDTDNLAWANGWHRPEVAVDALDRWDSTIIPDIKFNTQREPAAFFYRTEVEVPETFANREKIVLFFPSLIARAMRIWINGEPVMFDHDTYQDEIWRGPTYFWIDYNHSRGFDVTPHIRPGERNTIAFRVFKSFDHGGTYDRVFLLADPPENAIR